MDNIFVAGTKQTPEVNLERGKIKFTGRSVPSDPECFYQPLLEWMNEYHSKGLNDTHIELKFEYINTASTKWIFNILKLLGSDPSASNKIQVSWYYEEGDDDMYDLGKIFMSLVPSDFKFIEIPEQA